MLDVGSDFYLTSFEVFATLNSQVPLPSLGTICLLHDLASLCTDLSSDDTLLVFLCLDFLL